MLWWNTFKGRGTDMVEDLNRTAAHIVASGASLIGLCEVMSGEDQAAILEQAVEQPGAGLVHGGAVEQQPLHDRGVVEVLARHAPVRVGPRHRELVDPLAMAEMRCVEVRGADGRLVGDQSSFCESRQSAEGPNPDASGSIFPQLSICDLVPPNETRRRKAIGMDSYNALTVVTNPWEAALSPDGKLSLAQWSPSPDGKLVAYGLAEGGADWQTLHVREVDANKDLSDDVKWMRFSEISWTQDSKGFFYSRYPEPPKGRVMEAALSGHALYYHRVGTPQSQDTLVYERKDIPSWIINGDVTEDGRYLLIPMWEGAENKNSLYVADLGRPPPGSSSTARCWSWTPRVTSPPPRRRPTPPRRQCSSSVTARATSPRSPRFGC